MGRVRSCQIHDAEYDSPKIYHVIDKAEFWCLVEVCCLRLEWRCPAPKSGPASKRNANTSPWSKLLSFCNNSPHLLLFPP
jgi:hypothetical protein